MRRRRRNMRSYLTLSSFPLCMLCGAMWLLCTTGSGILLRCRVRNRNMNALGSLC